VSRLQRRICTRTIPLRIARVCVACFANSVKSTLRFWHALHMYVHAGIFNARCCPRVGDRRRRSVLHARPLQNRRIIGRGIGSCANPRACKRNNSLLRALSSDLSFLFSLFLSLSLSLSLFRSLALPFQISTEFHYMRSGCSGQCRAARIKKGAKKEKGKQRWGGEKQRTERIVHPESKVSIARTIAV